MGVLGLWDLLTSNGHPIKLEAFEGKRIAVDANVWLFKFIRGFREKDEGGRIDGHQLGLFNRICKLLFYKIKPVFVFDGPAPMLKKKTLERRKDMRSKTIIKGHEAARKLIFEQLKANYPNSNIDESIFQFPDLTSDLLAAAEKLTDEDRLLFQSVQQEVNASDSDQPIEYDNTDEDEDDDVFDTLFSNQKHQRTSTTDLKQVHDVDVKAPKRNLQDIDIFCNDFKNLPPEVRHEILTDIKESRRRIRSRVLPEDADSFSSLQMERLKNRRLVQEKIEECEREIQVSLAEDANIDNRRVVLESYRVQSDPTSRMLYLKNLIDQKNLNQILSTKEEEKSAPQEETQKLKPLVCSIKDRIRQQESLNSFRCVQDSIKSKLSKKSALRQVLDIADLSETSSNSSDDTDTDLSRSGKPLIKETDISSSSSSDANDTIEISESRDKTVYHIDTDDEVEIITPEKPSSIETALENVICDIDDKKVKTSDKQDQTLDDSVEVVYISTKAEPKKPKLEFNEAKSQVANSSPHEVNINHMNGKSLNAVHAGQGENKDREEMPQNQATQALIRALELDSSFDSSVCPEQSSIQISEKPIEGVDEISKPQNSTNPVVAPGTSNEAQRQNDVRIAQSIEQARLYKRTIAADIRKASKVTDKIIAESMELLRLFGIPYVVAPGEAEAQCAALERLGLTEGTITDDSDIWLFGAQNVYRYFFSNDKYVLQYKMRDIEFHLRLTRENLICFAMLVGSDYTDGIRGVGSVTALEILSEFPGNGMEPLVKLKEWKDKYVKDKGRRPGNKKRETFLKLKLPEQFPSRVVFDGYMQPVADLSDEKFSWSLPRADELREYAKRNLGWSDKQVDEKLIPVMKKLEDKKSQPTIDSFFFKTQANLDPERFRSKRVNRALGKMVASQERDAGVQQDDEEQLDDNEAEQKRRRKKAKAVMKKEADKKKQLKNRKIAKMSAVSNKK